MDWVGMWPWMALLGAAIVTCVLVAYAGKGVAWWVLRRWPWFLLALLVVAGLTALWLYYAAVLAWLWSWLPSSGPAMPALPASVTAWITLTSIVAAAMLLTALVILFLAGWGKIGWKRAATLAAILLIAALATIYWTVIVAVAADTPDKAAVLWETGGPVIRKLFVSAIVISIGLACLFGIPKLSTWGERAAAFGATLLVGYICWVAIWNVDWERRGYPAYATSTTTAPSVTCPGNGESKTVGPDVWVTINPGFGCHIIFEVVGAEMLLGEPDNNIKASPGDKLGNTLKEKGVRVISVKTTGGRGYLNYKLYPQGCTERGWNCS